MNYKQGLSKLKQGVMNLKQGLMNCKQALFMYTQGFMNYKQAAIRTVKAQSKHLIHPADQKSAEIRARISND